MSHTLFSTRPHIPAILAPELSGTLLQHHRQLEQQIKVKDEVKMKLANYGRGTRQRSSGLRI